MKKQIEDWLLELSHNEVIPENIVALNFGIFESENGYCVYLIGSESYDVDDDDWACDEVFTTRDQPFVIECESDWELVETFFISLVNEYLSSGKYAGKLKEYQAIGIGFVDGDLQIFICKIMSVCKQ